MQLKENINEKLTIEEKNKVFTATTVTIHENMSPFNKETGR